MQSDNNLIKSVALYRAFSSSVTYNYDALDDSFASDVSTYNAIVNRNGICQSFAGAYTYLLLQVGIGANTCGGLTYNNETAHECTIFNLDGKYNYADPTFETDETGGLGLKYLGIITIERKSAGDFDPESFRSCKHFVIDHNNNLIICFDENGNDYITFG